MSMNAADFIKEIELDGEVYRVAMCSAKDQRSVMFKLAHYGMEGALKQVVLTQSTGLGADIAALGIMSTLMSRIPEHDFNAILDMVLGKVHLVDGGQKVDLNHFQGRMQDYLKLGILALGVNFADFSRLLTLFRSSTVTAEDQEKMDPQSTQQSTGNSGDPAQE